MVECVEFVAEELKFRGQRGSELQQLNNVLARTTSRVVYTATQSIIICSLTP